MKYALIQIESFKNNGSKKELMILISEHDTLEEAKYAQEEIEFKTIIIQTF